MYFSVRNLLFACKIFADSDLMLCFDLDSLFFGFYLVIKDLQQKADGYAQILNLYLLIFTSV